MDEKKQQELIMKLNIYEQQMQQLQQQLQAIEEGIVEMNSLNFGLDEIEQGKGEEVLSPLGRGVFAKTKLISKELLVDVGDKNFVTKSVPETKKIIKDQIKKLNEMKIEIQQKLSNMEKEIQELLEKAQSEEQKSK